MKNACVFTCTVSILHINYYYHFTIILHFMFLKMFKYMHDLYMFIKG